MNPNEIHQKAMQARSVYDRSSTPTPVSAAPQRPMASPQPAEGGESNVPLWKAALKHALTLAGVVGVTLLVLYWPVISGEVSYWWKQRTTEPFQPATLEETNALFPGEQARFELDNPQVTEQQVIPPDNRIVIDKVEVNAPVVEMASASDQDVLNAIETGVGRYPETAKPGQPGNAFLTAHSSYWWWDPGQYKFVFQHLDDLVIGDVVTVYYNQRRYDYRVREIKTVKPKGDHIDALFAQKPYLNDPILTLMTCTPVGTTLNRLIVISELIGEPSPVSGEETAIQGDGNLPALQ